jgi:glycine/betaine/sarcosine/D-proline reductase family selenoprotein B
MSDPANEFGFAPDYDEPIPYRKRIRDYYLALGYDTPYRWAHYAQVPFTPLKKPLSQARLTLITTAAPYNPAAGDQGPWSAYNSAAKFYNVYSLDSAADHDVRISHVGIDRKHTSQEDSGTWFPLPALREAAKAGLIGPLAPRIHGLPTNRSHKTTLEVDTLELLARVKEDGADAAILCANCPVCHQSISLAARTLEAAGIPTVVMGCAKDIVEYVGVPRFLFSDFPLGNAAGRPHDKAAQKATLELALKVLESAVGPRTTVQNPIPWSADPDWKNDYNNIERMPPEELARRRAEFDKGKQVAKQKLAEDMKLKGAAE